MFGSRKGFQARPPPPPKQRKTPAAPPRRKQLFAFDPVAAHYNALNHEKRHGVTQPIVCVDLNAASERRRWRETADLSEAAATIKALVPEAANEGDATLERALAAHLRRRATPSIRCWDLVKARLAFQRVDCCVYCGEALTRDADDEAVPCRSFKRPGGCAAEAHRRCLARAGVGLQTTRWTCDVCIEVARRRSVRTPADQRAADAQEAEAAAAAALRASGTTPSTAPRWVAELAQRGGQKSRRVAQQRRKVDGRRRDAEAAHEALREARATAAQAKHIEAGVLNLAAYLAALDDDRAPRPQALVAKMVAAKDEWRADVDAMLSGEAPAAANAREADDLLKQDELYLEDLERAPDDAGGWSRRFIEEPDLDAWPWSGSADVAEKMRLFARLQKQLRDTLDASLLGGPGAIASGVTCVAPKSSNKFAYEACLWTRDPALAKIAVNMDRELLPGRVERANLSTFGDFTVDEKPPGLPDFPSARPGACFVLFRRRRLPSNPSSPRVSAS